jgi:hypothetical protein
MVELSTIGWCQNLVGAKICNAKKLAAYDSMSLVWFVAKILAANGDTPTSLTGF